MINSPTSDQVKQEREYAEEQSALNRAHEITIKEMELKLEKQKHSTTQLLTLPLEILYLPVRVLLIVPLTAGVIKGKVPEELWKLFR